MSPAEAKSLMGFGFSYGLSLMEYLRAHFFLFLPFLCALTAAQGWMHYLLRRRRVRAGFTVSVLAPLALLFVYLLLESAYVRNGWGWDGLSAWLGVTGIFLGAFTALLLRLLLDFRRARRRTRSEAAGGGPPL